MRLPLICNATANRGRRTSSLRIAVSIIPPRRATAIDAGTSIRTASSFRWTCPPSSMSMMSPSQRWSCEWSRHCISHAFLRCGLRAGGSALPAPHEICGGRRPDLYGLPAPPPRTPAHDRPARFSAGCVFVSLPLGDTEHLKTVSAVMYCTMRTLIWYGQVFEVLPPLRRSGFRQIERGGSE